MRGLALLAFGRLWGMSQPEKEARAALLGYLKAQGVSGQAAGLFAGQPLALQS